MRWWYLRRAVPWAAVGGCSLAAAVGAASLHPWPENAAAVLPLVLAACAAACGFVFDDVATSVTTVTPRGDRWRRTTRLAAGLLPLGTWVLLVASTPGRLALDRPGWLLAGAGAALSSVGVAAFCARRQVPRPGPAVAGVVVLLAMLPVVAGPFLDWEPVYPTDTSPARVVVLWTGLAVLGAALVAASYARRLRVR